MRKRYKQLLIAYGVFSVLLFFLPELFAVIIFLGYLLMKIKIEYQEKKQRRLDVVFGRCLSEVENEQFLIRNNLVPYENEVINNYRPYQWASTTVVSNIIWLPENRHKLKRSE